MTIDVLDSLNLDYDLIDDGPFKGLLSCADAAAIWEIDQSAIRHAIRNYRLRQGRDCKKFGKQWVVSGTALDEALGYRPPRWPQVVQYLTQRREAE